MPKQCQLLKERPGRLPQPPQPPCDQHHSVAGASRRGFVPVEFIGKSSVGCRLPEKRIDGRLRPARAGFLDLLPSGAEARPPE